MLKRSPIQRRTPLRATAPAKAELPTSRCKAKGCRVKFVKLSMNHRACSVECARLVVSQDKEDKARKETREHKAKLADSKPLSHWVALTEAVVHRYIH
ncbi:recombination protein NinG, partial [Roseateles sp. P5_E11]